MIGNYGKLENAKVQEFVAQATRDGNIIRVHTDGVVLSTEESGRERAAGFVPAFRLRSGMRYRVTVEELD
jgi:hypothetical protein